jgi:predicted transcriptional regulator
VQLSVRVDQDLVDRLRTEAHRRRVSNAYLVEAALADFFRVDAEKVPA